MLTQFGQGTTSGKFSMRAFNGEGEINAVKLLIDGVPSNSNDGNMPYIDLAPRLDIESIEVVRGTNDPRYGLHNIAGNANISTKAVATTCSGGPPSAALPPANCRPRPASRRTAWPRTTRFAQPHRWLPGPRQRRERQLLRQVVLHAPGGTSRFGLIARHYTASADEAGYLTRAQARANPDQSPAHNATDEDRRQVSQFALQGESELGGAVLERPGLPQQPG
jgi:iron complex outermembrane receptor protein